MSTMRFEGLWVTGHSHWENLRRQRDERDKIVEKEEQGIRTLLVRTRIASLWVKHWDETGFHDFVVDGAKCNPCADIEKEEKRLKRHLHPTD